MNMFQKGLIQDNEINEVSLRPLVYNASHHTVVDTCYSTIILGLPFLYCTASPAIRTANGIVGGPPPPAVRRMEGHQRRHSSAAIATSRATSFYG
jgi:hypothetical protein